ncbi:Nudix hydrolase 12, mitochondrial [Triticum urartu]|uniref:Nudix hydrolase 12, mitochondrial n=1 Tax=Triticum urartu TaxID=4572 RepID=M7ZKU5_TRIUA|nr:Nudix hydrolase 12, mitochondrial [Triticum urartu]
MASEKLVARKGRLRQRYDNEYRLVAGCVPYRVDKDGQLEVLMVSTANRDDLVFPKGGWEDDEDVYEAACREALEEAGVRGNINRNPLGLWVFRSKSRQSLGQSSDSPRGACKGHVFALEVTEELKQWPEQETHGRRWLSPADAYGLCRRLRAFKQHDNRQSVRLPPTMMARGCRGASSGATCPSLYRPSVLYKPLPWPQSSLSAPLPSSDPSAAKALWDGLTSKQKKGVVAASKECGDEAGEALFGETNDEEAAPQRHDHEEADTSVGACDGEEE